MALYKIDSEEASIVFVGSFYPAIFHPEWLTRYGLIPPDDLKSAKVEIVHNDISKFALEWLAVDVLRNRFTARTNDPSCYSPLKDLMISIFKILEHTPINQLGMNLSTTYIIDTEQNWHKIGDALAPKKIWNESLPARVGLTSLSVKSPRPDSLEGEINVRIQPIGRDIFGVNFEINNHIELKNDRKNPEEYMPPQILAQHWDKAIDLSKNIGKTTLDKILK